MRLKFSTTISSWEVHCLQSNASLPQVCLYRSPECLILYKNPDKLNKKAKKRRLWRRNLQKKSTRMLYNPFPNTSRVKLTFIVTRNHQELLFVKIWAKWYKGSCKRITISSAKRKRRWTLPPPNLSNKLWLLPNNNLVVLKTHQQRTWWAKICESSTNGNDASTSGSLAKVVTSTTRFSRLSSQKGNFVTLRMLTEVWAASAYRTVRAWLSAKSRRTS